MLCAGNFAVSKVSVHTLRCVPDSSNVSVSSSGSVLVASAHVRTRSSYVSVGSKQSRSKHEMKHPDRGVLVRGYRFTCNRNKITVNDRVSNNVHGIAVHSYLVSGRG